MSLLILEIVLGTAFYIAAECIPSLFRRNLPKPIHRLRLATWVIVLAIGVSFLLIYEPSLEPYRLLLKITVVGSLVMLIAVLAVMAFMLKSRGKS